MTRWNLRARAIGQKVAESESARELIERIKQVMHRRRLTTPPTSGPGSKLDPNTIADYLDNAVTPEQAAEVEQICLSSDVHLAEVAACHQILTLILGEAVRAPAGASQRMYGLVKGTGAAHARKAPGAKAKTATEPYSENREIDETLRLGLPALRRSEGWRNPLILVGGGVLVGVVLVIAILQVLSLPGYKGTENKADTVVQADKAKNEVVEPVQEGPGTTTSVVPPEKKRDNDKPPADKKDPGKEKKRDEKKEPEAKEVAKAEPAMFVEAPFRPPNLRQAPIGQFIPVGKESAILLQQDVKQEWKRLTPTNPEVYSARPLLSLPGSRTSTVQTNRGARLTLWGNMTPEFIYAIPAFFESMAELYAHDVFDLDLLLQRGRVVITSTRAEKPVSVRVRFENPMVSSDKDLMLRQECFDITLLAKGASVLVDRWCNYPSTEPFYKNPKNPNRVGPTANMVCMVLEGKVRFKTGDVTYTMTAPPGPGLMLWNSLTGPKGPSQLDKTLDFVLDNPPLPPGLDPKVRKDMVRARENLAAQLASGGVDVGLAQALYSPDPSMRRLVVRSLAAVNDLAGLLEALDQSKLPDLRTFAHDALRDWIATSRDNDYKLFELLKQKYKNKEAEIIMEMLHGFSEAEIRRPERYELLIDYLVNPNLVIRELGAWHLYKLVPAGKNIPYSAAADSQTRARAEAAWRSLIPPGQLPPALAPMKK